MIILDTVGDTIQAQSSNSSSITVTAYGIETVNGNNNYKKLGQVLLTGAIDTVYTTPPSTSTICTLLVIANTTNIFQTITLWNVPNGDVPSDANVIFKNLPVPPNDSVVWHNGTVSLASGKSIEETDPIVGAVNGIVKSDGNGNISAATNTDAEIADAVSKAHTQNTDTKLQDGSGLDSVVVSIGGIVSFPKQSVFRAKTNTSQPIPTNAWTLVKYDNEEYDNQSEYDNTTNFRFTALQDGTYSVKASLCSASVLWAAGKYWQIALYKNGSRYTFGTRDYVDADVTRMIMSTLFTDIYLNAGDYIDIRVKHNNGSDVDIKTTSAYNFFSVVKVG